LQQRWWQSRSAEGDPCPAFHYLEIETTGLDAPRLAEAWRRLVDHHDGLRVEIEADGQQRIHPPGRAETIAIRDLGAAGPAPLAVVRQEILGAAPLAGQGSPFHLSLTRAAGSEWLHLLFDPLRLDAPSLHLLVMQWARLYLDHRPPLVPVELSFRDYVLGRQARASSPQQVRGLALWEAYLSSLPPLPAPAPGPLRLGQRKLVIPRAPWKRAKAAAWRAGLSPSALLFAAQAEVVGRSVGSPTFTLDVLLFDRLLLHPQVNHLVGNFVSMLPIAIDRPGGASFLARARTLQRRLLEMTEHWSANPVRGQGGSPFLFTSALAPFTEGGVAEAHANRESQDPFAWLGKIACELSTKPGVHLESQALEDGGDLIVQWFFRQDIFAAPVIDQMLEAFRQVTTIPISGDSDEANGGPTD
jgi:hypothetical protein